VACELCGYSWFHLADRTSLIAFISFHFPFNAYFPSKVAPRRADCHNPEFRKCSGGEFEMAIIRTSIELRVLQKALAIHLGAIAICGLGVNGPSTVSTVVVRPKEIHDVLVNPGMGLLHFSD